MSKPLALVFALLTVAFFTGVSGSIAYRSLPGILLFLFLGTATVGTGFTLKKRAQEKEENGTEGEQS